MEFKTQHTKNTKSYYVIYTMSENKNGPIQKPKSLMVKLFKRFSVHTNKLR